MQGLLDITPNALVGAPVKATGAPNTQVPITASILGDMCVAQGMPERSELVRQGNSWGCVEATGQASTFLNLALPTTAFAVGLINGSLKSLIIDRVFIQDLTAVSAAAQAASVIVANVAPSAAAQNIFATGTAITSNLFYSLSGKPAYNGQVAARGAGTVTAVPAIVATQWAAVGNSIALAASAAGFALEALVYGRYIVPPGGAFLVNAIAGAATGTFVAGVEWHEVALPLG